jgi:hypothetical protein
MCSVLADEVDLVGDQDRRNLVVLGDDEEAVDESRVRRRMVAGEDGKHEVRVGDHHVLAPGPPRTGLAPAESALARLDRLDDARPVGQALQPDAVADDRQVRCPALLLDPATQSRLDEVILIGQHGVEAGPGAQDEAVHAHPRAPTAMP